MITKMPIGIKKTAAELGMSDDVYENSIYEALYNGTFNVTSANFQGNDDLCTSIGNYIVTSNGEDIYIYYTELSQDSTKNGTEIYGVRYQRGTDNGYWKFGNSVQITDFGMVIDELDLYMTDDNKNISCFKLLQANGLMKAMQIHL